jgi:hypothetical protein
MSAMLRQISCPNCGGPLQVESAFTTLLVSVIPASRSTSMTPALTWPAKRPGLPSILRGCRWALRAKSKGRAFACWGECAISTRMALGTRGGLQFDNQRIGVARDKAGILLRRTITKKAKTY